jgi:hypothetical protein
MKLLNKEYIKKYYEDKEEKEKKRGRKEITNFSSKLSIF